VVGKIECVAVVCAMGNTGCKGGGTTCTSEVSGSFGWRVLGGNVGGLVATALLLAWEGSAVDGGAAACVRLFNGRGFGKRFKDWTPKTIIMSPQLYFQ